MMPLSFSEDLVTCRIQQIGPEADRMSGVGGGCQGVWIGWVRVGAVGCDWIIFELITRFTVLSKHKWDSNWLFSICLLFFFLVDDEL